LPWQLSSLVFGLYPASFNRYLNRISNGIDTDLI